MVAKLLLFHFMTTFTKKNKKFREKRKNFS